MKNLLAGDGAAPGHRASVGKFGVVMASAVIGATSLVAAPAFAQGGSTTMQLIRMMHDNGSITDTQYQQLMNAAQNESAAAAQSGSGTLANTNGGSSDTVTTGAGTGFSDNLKQQFDSMAWAQKIKLTGDVRLRYEYNSNNDALGTALGNPAADTDNRSRGRVRYRLGMIANPVDNLELGAGLASGGDDPRSTNQTFGDNFSSKGIQLDYAYGQYDFTPYLANGFQLKAIGGKFKFGDYLWHPTDAMWDGDINPEGGSVHLAKKSSIGETFLNSGVWVIQENSGSNQDPYLWYVQGGQHFSVNNFIASIGGTYYGFEETYTGDNAPDTVFEYGSGTNTTSQFSVVDVDGTIGTKFDGGKAELIGQYLKNTHEGVGKDAGWAVGGKASLNKWGMKYLYVDLDRNVVPDSYPDSDRFSGATGMKGHEVAVSYALNDAIEFGVDYYNTESKFGPSDDRQNLVQTDVEFSF
ncbi:putative porin [Salinisphaera sp. Q1T1-3]|uniref:putative porin n=1 Tax=Salinisphaera sp. Q1T1-3 TaxID=2321229 RepID=UPI000E70C50F|nr:putative porin [Salinisphaera sp. Q1T1-3]RJS95045.1 hypothetical protein D3260_00345 [Salinisphaera sp. Q1T1-3]